MRGGHVIWRDGVPVLRLWISKNQRPWMTLEGCTTEREANARADAIVALAKPLIAMGRPAVAEDLAKRAARARTAVELESVKMAAQALVSGDAVPRTTVTGEITFKEFGELWTGGELHKRWPQRIREKKTSRDDGYMLGRYVYPVIGHLPIASITLDNAEEVLARVPADKSPGTVRHVAQLVARIMKMAAFPAKVIKVSPLPDGFLPKIDKTYAFTYLYPEEDVALLRCTDVPLLWRMLYGVLAREGLRAGEVKALDWIDLDLTRGAIHLDENKTDDPRSWALRGDVVAALLLWRKRGMPSRRVFAYEDGRPIDEAARAEEFRAHLKRAGVTRKQLFDRTSSRRPIRIHDLRATFVTISLANGQTESWVADRTGHRSSSQINTYRRMSRTHAELGLGNLGSMVELIPEFAKKAE